MIKEKKNLSPFSMLVDGIYRLSVQCKKENRFVESSIDLGGGLMADVDVKEDGKRISIHIYRKEDIDSNDLKVIWGQGLCGN